MRISVELRDLLAAAAFSALLFATGVLMPLLGPAAGFFSAAPLIWVAGCHGRLAGVLAGTLAAAALLPVLPPPVALIFAIEHALPAWYLGWRIRGGRGLAAGSAIASLAVTLLVMGAALLLADSGQDPAQVLELQLREGLAGLGGRATDGVPQDGGAADLSASLEELLAFVRRVLPALTLIGIFLECSLNSLLAARALARGGAVRPLDLTGFKLPERLVWVFIAALALCWAPRDSVATVALNILLPLLVGYLLQGLSIALHLAARGFPASPGRCTPPPWSSSPGCSPYPCCSGFWTSASDFASAGPPSPPPVDRRVPPPAPAQPAALPQASLTRCDAGIMIAPMVLRKGVFLSAASSSWRFLA